MILDYEKAKDAVFRVMSGKVSTVTATRVILALKEAVIGAVEVVRCKDCKHSYKSSGSSTGYRCCRWGIYDEDCDCDSNGFCHKGERRSDNAAD